jgi:hypothetical protein
VATFKLTYRVEPQWASRVEEIEADRCLDVGNWIEFLGRNGHPSPTVLRVIDRSTLSRVLELSESGAVLHQLQEEMTRAQASDLIEELQPLVDSPSITRLDVRATGRFLTSVRGADLVAHLDRALSRSGKALRTTAVTTRSGPVGRRELAGGWHPR